MNVLATNIHLAYLCVIPYSGNSPTKTSGFVTLNVYIERTHFLMKAAAGKMSCLVKWQLLDGSPENLHLTKGTDHTAGQKDDYD